MAIRNLKTSMAGKRHIVRSLARGTRHAQIVDELREKFGLTVHVRAIGHYNPKTNPRLDDDLKLIYDQTKALYWTEIEAETKALVEQWRQERESEREGRRRDQNEDERAPN